MLRYIFLLAPAVCALMARGQSAPRIQAEPQPVGAAADLTPGDALRSLASRAGSIVVGEVVAIRRDGDRVEVSLRVEQSLVGQPVAHATFSEWAGLWTGGRQRYRVGQRAMFFLYPANAAGVASPVDGMDGVVPLVPTGEAAPLLDGRRLAARLRRRVGQPMTSEALGVDQAARVISAWVQGGVIEPAEGRLPLGIKPKPQRRLDAAR